MDEGVDSRRVGLLSTGAPARQHSKIFTEDGEEVCVCSCLTCLGWSLKMRLSCSSNLAEKDRALIQQLQLIIYNIMFKAKGMQKLRGVAWFLPTGCTALWLLSDKGKLGVCKPMTCLPVKTRLPARWVR